jgi:4a-hydroxytetrahydrobiopterin dehydratase
MRGKLSQDEIDEKLGDLPDWGSDGKSISRRFEFKSFKAALKFVNQIGEIAERENHHPDIELGWGYAQVTFTTHDAGGVTAADFKLAKLVDGVQV